MKIFEIFLSSQRRRMMAGDGRDRDGVGGLLEKSWRKMEKNVSAQLLLVGRISRKKKNIGNEKWKSSLIFYANFEKLKFFTPSKEKGKMTTKSSFNRCAYTSSSQPSSSSSSASSVLWNELYKIVIIFTK